MENKTLNLITKLNNTNYFHWKQKMELLLLKENLWHIVNQPRPNQFADTTLLTDWELKNNTARGLIGLAIEDSQLIHIKNKSTATGLWEALKIVHERETVNSQITIMKKLCRLQMDEKDDLEKHINLISEQQLNDMGNIIEERWMIAILLLLLDSFDNVADTLEARQTSDLNWGMVTSKLLDSYNRRKNRSNSEEINASELANKVDPFCSYCKRQNHKINDCKFLKAKKQRESKREKKTDLDLDEENYVLTINVTNETLNGCIIDSGSPYHICNDINKFQKSYTMPMDVKLKLPDGSKISTTQRGTCEIKTCDNNGKTINLSITGALFVPQLKNNLLSVSKLLKKDFKVIFNKNKCEIKKNGKIIAIGKIKRILYEIVEQTAETEQTNQVDANREKEESHFVEIYFDALDNNAVTSNLSNKRMN